MMFVPLGSLLELMYRLFVILMRWMVIVPMMVSIIEEMSIPFVHGAWIRILRRTRGSVLGEIIMHLPGKHEYEIVIYTISGSGLMRIGDKSFDLPSPDEPIVIRGMFENIKRIKFYVEARPTITVSITVKIDGKVFAQRTISTRLPVEPLRAR